MDKESILGFDVCINSKDNIINEIFKDYCNNKKIVINSVNPEIITNNYKNQDFLKTINSQKYQIPDGIGVVYASKINKGKIKERIAGIDLMYDIIAKAATLNSRIFLYGSKPGIAYNAKLQLEDKYKDINIIGVCDGYIAEKEAIRKINEKNPDILFVGIGSPKQEEFIIKNKEKLNSVKIFMPVGGSLDVISNNLKRAPNWMIKLNLEWFYRLIKQPARCLRQLKLIKFVFLVIFNRLFRKEEDN